MDNVPLAETLFGSSPVAAITWGLGLLIAAGMCSVVSASETANVAKVRELLNQRRLANPAWVRAQKEQPFSKDDPADFFTDPAELKVQRQRGAAMLRAVAAAIRSGEKSYTVAPGEYRIAKNKGWIFHEVGDFTVNAYGARVWFERDDISDVPWRLFFLHCRSVTVKGLSIDFDPPVFVQGTIDRISDDRRTIEMKIDPAWPKVPVPEGAFTIYSPAGEYVHQISRGMHHDGAELFDGDRLRVEVRPGPRFSLDVNFDPQRAAYFGDRYRFGPGYLIALNYRLSHAVTIKYSSGITLEDVNIWQSPGGAIDERFGEGGNAYRRLRIIRKPGTRRVHCATADHFHSSGSAVGPQIIGCEAGYASDDIINVYGNWRWLLKQIDERTVLVGSAVPLGKKLTFYERGELKYIDEAGVDVAEVVTDAPTLAEVKAMGIPKSARHIVRRNPGEIFRVTLKTPIQNIAVPEVLIDAHSHNADGLLVKDCYFHHSFSRAQLFGGTVNARIVNNIWDTMNRGIHIFEESWAYAMGPAPQNVEFSGNTVMNMGAGSDAVIVALVPAVVKLLNTQPSRNITIRDNLFINSAGVTMLYVDGGKIENNVLVEPRGYQRFQRDFGYSKKLFGHLYFPNERRSAISVWSCKNVNVAGNTIYYSGPRGDFGPLDRGKWTENITVGENHLFSLGKKTSIFETRFGTKIPEEGGTQ